MEKDGDSAGTANKPEEVKTTAPPVEEKKPVDVMEDVPDPDEDDLDDLDGALRGREYYDG